MNLHIFFDSVGFYARQVVMRVERLEAQGNTYINFVDQSKNPHPQIICLPFSKKAVAQRIIGMPPVQRVYFHFYSVYSPFVLGLLKKRNPSVKSVWGFWSAEFYNLPKFLPGLYEPFSQKYLPSASLTKRLRKTGSLVKSKVLGRPVFQHRAFIKSIQQIDYFACLLDGDYKNVIDYTRASKMKHIRFAYLSYEEVIDPKLLDARTRGLKILINHSADPSLNHFEVLSALKTMQVNNSLYMPMAYGEKQYGDEIITIARTWFGEQMEIQTDFLGKEAYTEQLKEIGFAIFNIKIQQGIGTILVLLWLGVKVFLKRQNPVYNDFAKWGMNIYSIEEDLPLEGFDKLLNNEKVEANRKLLKEKLSNAALDNYFKAILNVPV